LGRVRTGRTESRPIDLDLLVYGSERRASSRLTLPHPRMRERAFVLFPLAEIAPEYRLDGLPLTHWADQAGAAGIRKLDEPDWPPRLALADERP
jgi:2-amino-4-hydroxy-6-hydroxymethyldihydropteridine diphosphokinase